MLPVNESQNLFGVVLNELKVLFASNERRFDDFSHAIHKLPFWKRFQVIGIHVNAMRLMKGPNEILSIWSVNRGFATDRRVDHCQERGWNLNDCDSSHKCCSNEA